MVEGKESTRLGYITEKFPWEQRAQVKVNGRVLCRQGECHICWKSRVTASVHLDCLQGFKDGNACEDKPHRLWRFARARRPHPAMPSVVLPVPGACIALKLPEGYPSDDAFAKLPWLSPELVGKIRQLSSSSQQNILAGLTLSERLSGPRPQVKAERLPLNEIASWERGQGIDSVVRRNVGAQGSGHVRLVMDTYGIQKVESVPYEQSYNSDERRDDRVFITVPVKNDFGKCQATIAVLTTHSTFPPPR